MHVKVILHHTHTRVQQVHAAHHGWRLVSAHAHDHDAVHLSGTVGDRLTQLVPCTLSTYKATHIMSSPWGNMFPSQGTPGCMS